MGQSPHFGAAILYKEKANFEETKRYARQALELALDDKKLRFLNWNKMRIAIDCHTLEIKNWAGKEHFINSLLRSLSEIDLSNEYILYFRKKVSLPSFPTNWQLKFISLPIPFWQFYVLLDALLRKVDIFFVPAAYLISAINIFIPSIIVVFDLTPFLPEVRKTHKIKIRLLERMLLGISIRRAKKIITISENTKNDIIRLFRIDPQKIKVVYLASRPECRVIEDKSLIKNILKKYNLPDDFILFVGTLEPRKNIVRLIEAYAKLIEKEEAPKLVLVGKKGWAYQQFFAKVKELNLDKKIVFRGYIPDNDLPYIYNAAKVFVYPSLYEGFGLPPLEAMACGCPVITSNISSLPEVVGEAAILVNPYKVDEIVLALEKILTDKNLRENLKQKGLIQAQKFSWQKSAKELLNIIYENKG